MGNYKNHPSWIFVRGLKDARARRNLRQDDIADMIKVSKTTIYKIEKGEQRVHVDTIKIIAEKLNFSINEIINGIEPSHVIQINMNGNDIKPLQSEENEILKIPVLSAEASCGDGIAYENSEEAMFLNPSSIHDVFGVNISNGDVLKNRFAWIRVIGESMEPTIFHNSIVLVDTDYNHIPQMEERGIFLIKDENSKFYIKQINSHIGNKISVISHNPDYESFFKITHQELINIFGGEIYICGKVVTSTSRLIKLKGDDFFRR